RDFHVTGVQTCALPISRRAASTRSAPAPASTRAKWAPKPLDAPVTSTRLPLRENRLSVMTGPSRSETVRTPHGGLMKDQTLKDEIGRASCKAREQVSVR